MLIDEIVCIQCDLTSVPWEGSTAAPVAPSVRPTPGHYHIPYRGRGEARVGWHGETYCLVGGYRCYGDAPLAPPAKVAAQKPGPRAAQKRHHPVQWAKKDLDCSRPKIPRLELEGKRPAPPELSPAKVCMETPAPRQALKRRCPVGSSREDLGWSTSKIPRLEPAEPTGAGWLRRAAEGQGGAASPFTAHHWFDHLSH